MTGIKRQLWRHRVRRAFRTPIRHWAAEGRLRLRRRIFWERWMDGRAWVPYSIGLWVTEVCDLDCPMCWVRPSGSGGDRNEERLTKAEWFRLIDEFAAWRPRLTITGGEPLLAPFVVDLIRYASSKGLRVNLGTNGTHLESMALDLVGSGLQDVSVSLDGRLDVHDRIRGKEGTFDAVRKGVAAILDARRKSNSSMPYVRLNCTLTKANQGNLRELISIAEEWEADSLSFQHLWYVTPEILRQHNDTFSHIFQQDSPNLSGFLVDRLIPDPISLVQEFDELQADHRSLPVYVYPELDATQIRQYYRQPSIAFKSRCRSRWFRTDIKPNGDVSPCLSFVAGNVRQSRFRDIWNNDLYRRFRRQLLTGLFPGCSRCCGLFSD